MQMQAPGNYDQSYNVPETIFHTSKRPTVLTTHTSYPVVRDGHKTPHYQVTKIYPTFHCQFQA